MEQRVILHSEQHARLLLCCEALTSLLFPFYWPHVYVPLLPLQVSSYMH